MHSKILIILIVCLAQWCRGTNSDSLVTISVYGLKSINVDESLALSLQEQLESHLLKFHQYSVVTRNNIDLILKEERFSQSGACNDEECILQAGHILGVQKLVTGTISRIGSTYNLVLKLIDLKSARLEASASTRHVGSIDGLLDASELALADLLHATKSVVAAPVIEYRIDTVRTTIVDTITMPPPVAVPTVAPAEPVTIEPMPSETSGSGAPLSGNDTDIRCVKVNSTTVGSCALVILCVVAAAVVAGTIVGK